MCIWKLLRGGICRKNSLDVESTFSEYGRSYLQSSHQFQEEFLRELTEDNLRELSTVFRMIDIASLTVSRSLYKFMNKQDFRNTFKEELKVYDCIIKKRDRTGHNALSSCLKYHCFAVLTSYLDMLEYIHDPIALDNFLEEIAISHSFIRNPRGIFEMHDFLFKQFMKQEFGKYTTRTTRQVLKKYLRLISTRLRVLIEQQYCQNDVNSMALAMQHQKITVGAKIDSTNSFKEVYVNQKPSHTSQFSLLPASAIYPGSSTGGRGSLDKRSK